MIIFKKFHYLFFTAMCIFLIFFPVSKCSAEPLTIQSRIKEGPWLKSRCIYPLKGRKIFLKVNSVNGGHIKWYQIFPNLTKIYKNANHPWEKEPYKWVGFCKIEYFRKEMKKFDGQWVIEPFEKINGDGFLDKIRLWFSPENKINSRFQHNDVGSFWFQAEVEKNGHISRSPGIKDSDKRGLSPRVLRVSVREREGYLGYLSTFFNVPGLFGSVPYQSMNYIGVDCADVLVAALAKWQKKTIKKDYNVAMLVNKFPKAAQFDIINGQPAKKIEWQKHVRPGDLIAVRYTASRQYQHIGALFSDKNLNGILDGGDLVIHAGPYPLQYSYLEEGPFDGHVVILRPG